MKTCKRCKEGRPDDQFRLVSRRLLSGEMKQYVTTICMPCESKAALQRYNNRKNGHAIRNKHRPAIMPGLQRSKRREQLILKSGHEWMGRKWLICELADEKGCCEAALKSAIKRHGIEKAMLMEIKTRDVDFKMSQKEKDRLAALTIADAIQKSRSSTIWSFLCSVPPPVFDESEETNNG